MLLIEILSETIAEWININIKKKYRHINMTKTEFRYKYLEWLKIGKATLNSKTVSLISKIF